MNSKAFDSDGDKAYQSSDSDRAYRVAGDVVPLQGRPELTNLIFDQNRFITTLKQDAYPAGTNTKAWHPDQPATIIPFHDPRNK